MAKAPSVLSFQRCLNVTDGMMFSIIASHKENEDPHLVPIKVIRHGIRGVLGDRKAADGGKDKEGLSNVQITETAKTDVNATGLMVKFNIVPLSIKEAIFGCNDKSYIDYVNTLTETACDSESLAEISRRYARNILNGRWLWRNRVLGNAINVSVKWNGGEAKSSGFGRMKDFNDYTADEIKLGQAIFSSLAGESKLSFDVEGVVDFGFTGAMEVYPSQNYTSSKPKGFARPLYKIDPISLDDLRDATWTLDDQQMSLADTIVTGKAGLRDQKIGNAIRTIDTWYSPDTEESTPIAIEPNGASLNDATFHRPSNNAFKMLDTLPEMILKIKASASKADPELMYLLAIITRGGVYGGKSDAGKAKAESNKKSKGKTEPMVEQVDTSETEEA